MKIMVSIVTEFIKKIMIFGRVNLKKSEGFYTKKDKTKVFNLLNKYII